MAPKYMVTVPPGAPVSGIGFIQPGQVFTAPADDYVPSLTFRPCNEEAKAILDKQFGEKKASLEKALADETDDKIKASRRQAIRELEAQRANCTIVELAKPAPVVEEGLTLKQLAELASAPGAAPAPATKPTSKRAADK
jgi:hypothetical protein